MADRPNPLLDCKFSFRVILFLFGAAVDLCSPLNATPQQDYRDLILGVDNLRVEGTAGSLAVEGPLSTSLALTEKNEVIAAAGIYGTNPKSARIVAVAHTSIAFGEKNSVFLARCILWVSQKAQPTVMLLGVSAKEWTAKYTHHSVIEWDTQKLSTVDLVVANPHYARFGQYEDELRSFLEKGGGLIIGATPWALSGEAREAVGRLLRPAGLAFVGSGPTNAQISLPEKPPVYLNATEAAGALLTTAPARDSTPITESRLGCALIESCISADTVGPLLEDLLKRAHETRGWIQIDAQRALKRKNHPVESLLVRYQGRLLEQLPPEKTPVHPSAADFPGLVEKVPSVTRVIRLNAKTGPDKWINHGKQHRIPTGLYAPPGSVIEVRAPESIIQAGLFLEVGIHTDANWNLDSWKRFPQVSRRIPLKQSLTRAANAFGGLLSIVIPDNCDVGPAPVSISGGVEAPVFTLGETSLQEWNNRIKYHPGAWGYIESPKWTGYFRRDILNQLENPESVATYWQKVVDTADTVLGYSRWRKRGEAMLTDRELFAGYGHAGFPVEMAYDGGREEDQWALARRGPEKGDWGFLHELGHTFQDSFDGAYTIATHAEVDVNLVPALVKNLVHDITCWDGKNHHTFDAPSRLADLQKWEELPESEKTWTKACSMTVAYDFYFTLAECLGWDLYRRAFSRWMDWLQKPGADAALDRVASKGDIAKRDRFFILFCEESGLNLLPFFQKYGLGKGLYGLSVDATNAVRALPEWAGNRPITSIEGPAELKIAAKQTPGRVIATFRAKDPDPGTIFRYQIVSGNESGAFQIEPRTGDLRIQGANQIQSTMLTIRAQDNCVPLSSMEIKCRIRAE